MMRDRAPSAFKFVQIKGALSVQYDVILRDTGEYLGFVTRGEFVGSHGVGYHKWDVLPADKYRNHAYYKEMFLFRTFLSRRAAAEALLSFISKWKAEEATA